MVISEAGIRALYIQERKKNTGTTTSQLDQGTGNMDGTDVDTYEHDPVKTT